MTQLNSYESFDIRDEHGQPMTEQEAIARVVREQEAALRALAEIALRIAPKKRVN